MDKVDRDVMKKTRQEVVTENKESKNKKVKELNLFKNVLFTLPIVQILILVAFINKADTRGTIFMVLISLIILYRSVKGIQWAIDEKEVREDGFNVLMVSHYLPQEYSEGFTTRLDSEDIIIHEREYKNKVFKYKVEIYKQQYKLEIKEDDVVSFEKI